MKFKDKERVDGTSVSIGRKVQFRTDEAGNSVERADSVYTAEFRDAAGKRRFKSLKTTNKREARRRAIELEQQLETGAALDTPFVPDRLGMADLIERYLAHCGNKGLTPTTLAKYKADTDKLRAYCDAQGIVSPAEFTEERFHAFGAHLRASSHKQRRTYATKTVRTALVVTKQIFRWGKKHRLCEDLLEAAVLPHSKPRPQPCFTTEQVEGMLDRCKDREGWETTHAAIAILGFTGLRVGELMALHWEDVLLNRGDLGVLRIHRGGSGESTKDKDERAVPIHPRIRPIIDSLPRTDALMLPDLRDRTLLARVKRLCRELHYGNQFKTHSLRHHFVSMCANQSVPLRLCMQWVGHSSVTLLNCYYALSDAESEAAMRLLARGGARRDR